MALRHIETEIEIEAPADRIWALLIDFSRAPSWNPFIRSIFDELAAGARALNLSVTARQAGDAFHANRPLGSP